MDFLSKFIRSKQATAGKKVKSVEEVNESNTSLKNQLNISVSEADQNRVNGEETSKENHSPRSLSSLAADKSRLVGTPLQSENNSTSTPKFAKKQEPSEFDPDISIEITPKYRRALLDQPVKDVSLSFLTNGLEKLGLCASDGEKSNFTLSDDDEAFQECQSSLTDLSGRVNLSKEDEKNNTLEEVPSPNSSNKTLVGANTTAEAINSATFNEEAKKTDDLPVEKSFVLGWGKPIDHTFDVPEVDHDKFSEVPAEFEENDGKEVTEMALKDLSPVDGCLKPEELEVTAAEEVNFDETFDKAAEKPFDGTFDYVAEPVHFDGTFDTEMKVPETPENFNSPQVFPEATDANNSAYEKTFNNLSSPVFLNHDENEVSPVLNLSQEALETPLPDSPVSEVEEIADVTMEDVSAERQEIVALFPESSENVVKVEIAVEPEIRYRNIDESGGKPDKTQTIPEMNEDQQMDPSLAKVFTEKLKNSFEVQFKMPAPVFKPNELQTPQPSTDEDFGCGGSYNFADSDFDYLNNIGSAPRNSFVNRDSVLLKFDPLLSRPTTVINKRLSEAKEVDDFVTDLALKIPVKEEREDSYEADESRKSLPKEHEMSAEIMKDYNTVGENKTQEEFISEKEASKASLHNNSAEYLEKMAELENKLKKEADLREEQLLKRISEKDKQISKMNGVVEAYEKAISELIAEKEQLVQSYERKCVDLKSDSELNANHLASLEATFSDLHAKYERAKHVAVELNEREKVVIQERQELRDCLKMQESRYDKMKSHAMAQLEIANNTLAEISRNHQAEVTKLKALLKKEEISRSSINEQLIQKSKENAELVKICDELINGTQQN